LYALNVKKISYETKPGFLYELKGKVKRIGAELEFQGTVMSVCKKNLLISLWCMPVRIDKDTQKIISGSLELQKSKPVCDMYFNTLVLMDLY